MDRSTQLGIVQIAALLRKDKADVSRSAARGEFGKPIIAKGSKIKRYALASVERSAGRKFSPEQIDKALATKDRQQPTRAAVLFDFASALLALRDCYWRDALEAQGVTFTPPEF